MLTDPSGVMRWAGSAAVPSEDPLSDKRDQIAGSYQPDADTLRGFRYSRHEPS